MLYISRLSHKYHVKSLYISKGMLSFLLGPNYTNSVYILTPQNKVHVCQINSVPRFLERLIKIEGSSDLVLLIVVILFWPSCCI